MSDDERAGKIRPEFRTGELVKVAGGRNLAEAELIQGILLEEGIPSTQRRTRGFDVPDFLAAGPRDILVPESGYEQARAVLADIDALDRNGGRVADEGSYPRRLFIGMVVAVLAALAIVWLLYQAVA